MVNEGDWFVIVVNDVKELYDVEMISDWSIRIFDNDTDLSDFVRW